MGEVTSVGISSAEATALINSLMPQPAAAVPPGVTDSGATGLGVTFARGDHTHASKARKDIKPIAATGLFTWTYPNPFAQGVVPICNGIAKCPSGTTALVNVQLEGDPTNTQCVFRVTVYQQSVATLIGLTVLSLTSSVPANTSLHLSALEP